MAHVKGTRNAIISLADSRGRLREVGILGWTNYVRPRKPLADSVLREERTQKTFVQQSHEVCKAEEPCHQSGAQLISWGLSAVSQGWGSKKNDRVQK